MPSTTTAPLAIYLICIAALALNLFFATFLTVMRRSKAKAFTNPEDAKAFKGEQTDKDESGVERAKAVHRNALESFVPFAILGLLYVMSGGSETGAMAYFITFTVARWLHSFFYLAAIQPYRVLAFVVGLLVNIGLMVQVLLKGIKLLG